MKEFGSDLLVLGLDINGSIDQVIWKPFQSKSGVEVVEACSHGLPLFFAGRVRKRERRGRRRASDVLPSSLTR
jgi:hypothetical protein